MNWEGLQPYKIARWGGGADWDDPTQLPNGIAAICLNSRFLAESVATRYGQRPSFSPPSGTINSLDVIQVLGSPSFQLPFAYADSGILLRESPPGSGTLVPVSPPFPLPAGAFAQDSLAFNRAYMALSDLTTPMSPPIVLDGPSGIASAISQNFIGARWNNGDSYVIGDLVLAADGRWWRCSSIGGTPTPPPQNVPIPRWVSMAQYPQYSYVIDPIGNVELQIQQFGPSSSTPISGATEPIWPTFGNTVSDGTTLWKNVGPILGPWQPNTLYPTLAAVTDPNGFLEVAQAGAATYPPWLANTFYSAGAIILDTNGNLQRLTSSGTSGPSTPSWNPSLGGQTTDQPAPSSRGIADIFPSNGGHNYTLGQILLGLIGGGGTGGAAQVTDVVGGSIVGVQVINPGSYTSAPSVHVGSPTGSGAVLIAELGPVIPVSPLIWSNLGPAGSVPFTSGSTEPGWSVTPGISTLDNGTNWVNVGLAPTTPNPNNEPNWPGLDGYFSGADFQSATITDSSGRTWEEWTPGTQGVLPSPSIAEVIAHNPGGGTIASGKDVYIKLAYQNSSGYGNISAPVKFVNTGANDEIILSFQQNGEVPGPPTNSTGGPRMPRWLAEFNLNPIAYTPFTICVFVAAVNTGDPAPTTYFLFAVNLDPGAATIAVTSIPSVDVATVAANGSLISQVIAAANFAPLFIGESGIRNMIVDRLDLNASLVPVDPGSSIPVVFVGSTSLAISTLSRDGSGVVTAAVADVSQLSIGQALSVQGTSTSSFNEAIIILSILPGVQYPAGSITYQSATISSGTATGGTLGGNGGPPPIIILPPGGPYDGQDIAAFTVAGQSTAGPYTYLPYPQTQQAVSSAVVSFESANGVVVMQVANGAGIAPGDVIFVKGFTAGSAGLNGPRVIGVVNGNTLIYSEPSGITLTTNPIGVSITLQPVLPTEGPPNTTLLEQTTAKAIVCQFSDNDLSNGLDITSQLTSIGVPPCIDAYYSESLARMVYTLGNTSDHYFSNIEDAANVVSPDGILSIASSNGGKTICFREMLNGELLSLKENGGYAVTPSANVPNQWNVSRRWGGVGRGPVGPRAVGLGPDWALIFTRDGPYRYYDGQYSQVGHEKTGTWDRVNWAAASQIWIEINEGAKEANIGLPLDGSTVCNEILTLNYFNGWDEPIIVTLTGEVIANRYGRRWTEQQIPARFGRMVLRQLATPVDSRINDRQFLYALPTGVVMEVPDVYDDSGLGIDWQYQPSYARSPSLEILGFDAVKGRVKGNGVMNLLPVTEDPSFMVKLKGIQLKANEVPTPFATGEKTQNELLSYNFSNGAIPGAWVELQEVLIGSKKLYDARQKDSAI